ncbi:hypothetical protein KAJ87_02540 [Candidatus Pacearchaeota archaeon]|nr:hypothetical protein [Candidatus Pacearchaeota archaeon]
MIDKNFFSYSFFPKNKRGDKIISVYWFAILILVAGGISAMVFVFYNQPYDVREIEANILTNNIADCLSQGGYLRDEFFDGENFLLNETNFLEKCELNFEVEEIWEEEQYYVKVEIYQISDLNNPVFNFDYGNEKWVVNCVFQEEKEFEKLSECYERRFYCLDKSGNQHLIKILSVINKGDKNVK